MMIQQYIPRSPSGGMDVNILPIRNLYAGADGGTLGSLGSASSPDQLMRDASPSGGDIVDAPAGRTVVGKPLNWWAGIAIVVALMLFAAKKSGDAGDFANIRASTYNVALITFVAVLGITFLKIVGVRVQSVPGLSGFATIVKAV